MDNVSNSIRKEFEKSKDKLEFVITLICDAQVHLSRGDLEIASVCMALSKEFLRDIQSDLNEK